MTVCFGDATVCCIPPWPHPDTYNVLISEYRPNLSAATQEAAEKVWWVEMLRRWLCAVFLVATALQLVSSVPQRVEQKTDTAEVIEAAQVSAENPLFFLSLTWLA